MDGKKIVFAGAAPEGAGTPWGTIALVTRRALQPLGYEVAIEPRSWGANNPRYVGDGKADIGATQYRAVEEAYQGVEAWAKENPRRNLRLIATINQPAWLAVAVRAELGITDLSEIAKRQMSVRLKASGEKAITSILEWHGLSRQKILEWGGHLIGAEGAPVERAEPVDEMARWDGRDWEAFPEWAMKGEFDVIIDPIYAANTPEHRHWWAATILYDLRFLPLPQPLIDKIMASGQAEAPGLIPQRLMRGVTTDIPTVQRFPQVIYTTAEAPDSFVLDVTRALDEGRELFRQTHMPYSYDPGNVARPRAVPLHPAAERYYREKGYLR